MAKSNPARSCSFEGCERPFYCKGLCQRHYEQQNEGKPLTPIRPKLKKQPDACTVAGCTRQPKAKGLCGMHNWRVRSHGQTGGPDSWRREGCQVEGCERAHQSNGYCATHLRRWQLYGDHDGTWTPQACKTPGCSNTALAARSSGKGYCAACWATRWLDAYLAGEAPAKRYPNGYEYFELNHQRYFVHRLVMERMLGRQLYPFESPHHKNGIRYDNRPENLELWTKPQPAGQRADDLVEWVVRFYPELVEAELRARKREARTGQLRLE